MKSAENAKTEALKPLTIRFTPDAWAAIRDIAQEHHMSQAELVRLAVSGNLVRYLGDVRYIDTAQGEEIKKEVFRLYSTLSKIERELHRIGVNYNQQVKLKNIERKYSNRNGFDASAQRQIEENSILKSGKDFTKEEIDSLMSRYEAAMKWVGEALCRIVV